MTDDKLSAFGDFINQLEESVKQNSIPYLKMQLVEKEKEAAEYLTKLKYLQADFENYKKWANKEIKNSAEYAVEKFVQNLLTAIDEFELAFKSSKSKLRKKELEAIVKGIELAYKNLNETLLKAGLKQINALGQKFDPFMHEAMLQVESDEYSDATVVEEFQKGYTFQGKVIRASKVKVAVPMKKK
jgi:molecular chaperone GrpE